ncbi:hypothetical protein [Winogradskyella flava]|uniref:Uncharacterized protein n=1 Tax=Winogradskyella flava TaxID=1884876 RepID=A0A842ITQ3_9FLAO|nr:hypothetical protein [Winogradskyella flava]MBC2844228.1 hypothetical protein [Winogradskyella flava]
MEIAYNKKRLRANLYLSVVWFILGVLQVVLLKDQPWLGLGWMFLSVIFFTVFLYRKKNNYVTINSEFIKQNWPFGKKVEVAHIKNVKYFSEDYIINTETDELRINTNLIEAESRQVLEDALLNLNFKEEWLQKK